MAVIRSSGRVGRVVRITVATASVMVAVVACRPRHREPAPTPEYVTSGGVVVVRAEDGAYGQLATPSPAPPTVGAPQVTTAQSAPIPAPPVTASAPVTPQVATAQQWLLTKVGHDTMQVVEEAVPPPPGGGEPGTNYRQWYIARFDGCHALMNERVYSLGPMSQGLPVWGAGYGQAYIDLSQLNPATCRVEGRWVACTQRNGGSLGRRLFRMAEAPEGGSLPAGFTDVNWWNTLPYEPVQDYDLGTDLRVGPPVGAVDPTRVLSALRDVITGCGGGGQTEAY